MHMIKLTDNERCHQGTDSYKKKYDKSDEPMTIINNDPIQKKEKKRR